MNKVEVSEAYYNQALTDIYPNSPVVGIGIFAGVLPFIIIPSVYIKLRELRNPKNITLNILNVYMFNIMMVALAFQGAMSIIFTVFIVKYTDHD